MYKRMGFRSGYFARGKEGRERSSLKRRNGKRGGGGLPRNDLICKVGLIRQFNNDKSKEEKEEFLMMTKTKQ